MELYFPSKKTFPSISSTGRECMLSCSHCKGYYLQNMIDASKEGLYRTCIGQKALGKAGALISGGSDAFGRVVFDSDELNKCMKIENFKKNIHLGLVDDIPPGIEKADAVSVDLPPSDRVVSDVYHLKEKNQQDYFDMLELFESNGVRYVPHICVGIEYGCIKGEIETIEKLSSYSCDQLVILSLKRTPKAPMTSNHINTSEYEKILIKARDRFKYLNLGCMRNKEREKENLWSYFDKIAWPSKIIKDELARNGVDFRIFDTCCSV